MGLREFLFGPRFPEDEGLAEEQRHPHYGHLADQEKLLEEIHAKNVEKQQEEEETTGKAPHLWGFERAAGRLKARVREEQLPKWSKISRKLGKLERKLEGAESPEDVRKIARRSLSQGGLFRKIERGMEKRLKGLEEEGASRGDIRKYERDLRSLERRLRIPSRYLR